MIEITKLGITGHSIDKTSACCRTLKPSYITWILIILLRAVHSTIADILWNDENWGALASKVAIFWLAVASILFISVRTIPETITNITKVDAIVLTTFKIPFGTRYFFTVIYMVKFLTFSIFTTPGSRTPSALYLYIVKIEDFHKILTAFLRILAFSVKVWILKSWLS